MPDLPKGETAPLNVTENARHRIFAGLGWDPNENPSIVDKAKALVGGPKTWHDLDLSCYLYDGRKAFIQSVTAENGKHIDESGKIYHSGDNEEGIGEGDDEQISAELKDLDIHIRYLVFVVTIKSGHTFRDVQAPEIRIADGYSGHTFLSSPLNATDGADKNACIFASIFRGDDDEWKIHNISAFAKADATQTWPAIIAAHLKA